MHRTRQNRIAFTLVELLVVIAIISALAGLLLPVLEDALASARMVECLNRLRQFMMANLAYVEDNRGWMPENAYLQLPQQNYLDHSGTFGTKWYNSTACWYDSCTIMYCPLKPISPGIFHRPVPFARRSSTWPYYLFAPKVQQRSILLPSGDPGPLVDLDYTHSEFIIWGDASFLNGGEPVTAFYSKGGPYVFNLRHCDMGTAAFADGHSACVNEGNLYPVYGIEKCYVGTDGLPF